MTVSANPFDLRTVLLARHAQHVVLVHFPIALYPAGVSLDLAGWWLDRENFHEAAYYNFSLGAIFALPTVATGLVAWQWQLEGQKLKGILLEHLLAGLTVTAATWLTWAVHYRARHNTRPLPATRFLLEGAGVLAVILAGHLGGVLSGVNGPS